MGHGSFLSPASHAAVDQSRVASQALVWAESQSFGHARPKPLDEGVGALDQRQNCFDSVRIFQVDRDGSAASIEYGIFSSAVDADIDRGLTIDADHVGAQVG